MIIRVVKATALLVFCITVFTAVMYHEPWRDEADVWLATRDDSLAGIAGRAGHSGTPLLWYAAVAPFARIGMPYISMQVLNALFAVGSAAVILWIAPLPLWMRIGSIFSYTLAYEYAVVARSYAAGTLLLLLFLAFWRSRRARPLAAAVAVSLMFHTTIHFLAVGIVLLPLWSYETFLESGRWKTVSWKGGTALTLSLVSLAAAALMLVPRSGGQFEGATVFRPEAVVWALSGVVSPSLASAMSGVSKLGAALLIAVLVWSSRSARVLIAVHAMVLSLLAIFVFGYAIEDGYRHFGMLLLVVLITMWLGAGDERMQRARGSRTATTLLLGLVLTAQVADAARHVALDIRHPYSGAESMGRFIRENGLAERPIAAHLAAPASAVLPYVAARTFYYLGVEADGSYMRWDRAYVVGERTPMRIALMRFFARYGSDCRALLLTNSPLDDSRLDEIHSSPPDVFVKLDERFFLYRRTDCVGASR